MRLFGTSFPALWGIAVLLAGTIAARAQPACPTPKAMGFEVQRTIALSMTGFTEGLEVHGRDIYESTGPLGGTTRLMRIAPDGHVTVIADFGRKFFGEGLTFL